jgi:hypothetical protein
MSQSWCDWQETLPARPPAERGTRRAAGRSPALDVKEPGFGSVMPVLPSPRGVHPHVPSAAI